MKVDKNILKSKTFWVSLIVAISPMFPQVKDLIASNPDSVMYVVGLIFGLLRIVTTKPISFKE